MYIPKNKIITDLYTEGGEYTKLIPNNVGRTPGNLNSPTPSTSYVGYYWKSQTGDIFTGRNPNDRPQEKLIPIIAQSDLSILEDIDNTLYLAGPDIQTQGEVLEYGGYNPNRIGISSYTGYISSYGVERNRKLPFHTYPLPNAKDYELGVYQRYFLQKVTTKEFLEVTRDVYYKIRRKDRNWAFELYQPFTIQWAISGEELEVQDANRNITLLTQRRLRTLGLTQFLGNNYLQYYEEDIDLEGEAFNIEDSTPSPTSFVPPSSTSPTPSTPSSPSPSTSGGGY